MGISKSDRNRIIDYCTKSTLAGMPIDPVELGRFASLATPLVIENLEIALDNAAEIGYDSSDAQTGVNNGE